MKLPIFLTVAVKLSSTFSLKRELTRRLINTCKIWDNFSLSLQPLHSRAGDELHNFCILSGISTSPHKPRYSSEPLNYFIVEIGTVLYPIVLRKRFLSWTSLSVSIPFGLNPSPIPSTVSINITSIGLVEIITLYGAPSYQRIKRG